MKGAIVDEQIIDGLYRAPRPVFGSRWWCADLRPSPGVQGLFSENIMVRSILGQFLEHSRVIHPGGRRVLDRGARDMMHRNLDRRVEVMAQVKDRRLTSYLDEVFESAMHVHALLGTRPRRQLDRITHRRPRCSRSPGAG